MKNLTDLEIKEALIRGDEEVTKEFFFKKCKGLFINVIHRVFKYEVDYSEFVNELYIHLMADDARRLRSFVGRSSIYTWLETVATFYFYNRKNHGRVIDNNSSTPLYVKPQSDTGSTERKNDAHIDVEALLAELPNQRYAYVLRRLIIDEAKPEAVADEMKIEVSNLYNIKKRALASITRLALEKR